MTLQEQITELKGKLTERQQRMSEIFAQAGPEFDTSKITSLSGDDSAKVEQIRALNTEMADLRRDLDAKEEMLRIALTAGPGQTEKAPSADDSEPRQQKSIGRLFVESEAFKAKNRAIHLDVDVKTLFERDAGWEPQSTRSGLVVDYATRPIQLTDLIPTINITQSAYKYMEETRFTNAAAETSEGGTYGEAALELTEKTVPVEKVAVWIPVTDEQLEDVAGAAAYIDSRLRFMLRQRFDYQILNGNGTTPNLQGILDVDGIGEETQQEDDLMPDAILRAITAVRVAGRAMPNAVVVHPTDWQSIRMLKTTEDQYIWGHPALPGPDTIWGLRVVLSDAFVASGTALVGDFANFSLAGIRRGIDVQVSNAHSDYFVKGKQAVRADFRAVLVWTRPAAFCTVTFTSVS